MKLTEAEDILEAIQKMPLAEKQKKIIEIQKQGFIYDDKELKEIVKDKWVFVENKSETDIVEIDYVILDWAEKEQVRLEIEQAESGKTVIEKYFKKYGVLSQKEKAKDGTLYHQIIYFGGKACPGGTWNSELFMHVLNVYKDNYDHSINNRVSFDAHTDIEDLMDAKIKGNEPTLYHCHDWYSDPHKKSEQHYSYNNWLKDIEKAKKLFIDSILKMVKGFEIFQYNSKNGLYCIPEQKVFWFEHKADHNGDSTSFYSSKIYGNNKYTNSSFGKMTSSVPKKFDKTITREEIVELAYQYCETKLEEHGFRKEFKY